MRLSRTNGRKTKGGNRVMRIESVDTRHGSLNKMGFSNGNTLPYTGMPFGMNYFVPQSQKDSNWYFDPTYPILQGFRLSHQPSPWMGDYSWLLFTPLTGHPMDTDLTVLQSSYKESEAIFQPHQLKLESLRYRLRTTVAPTVRGTKFQIERLDDKRLGLLLSAKESVKFTLDKERKRLLGILPQSVNDGKSVLNMYIVLDFSHSTVSDIELNHADEKNWSAKKHVEAKSIWLQIESDAKVIEFSLGTSFISKDQAEVNLEREVLSYSLNELIEQSANEWEQYLNKVVVKDRQNQKVREFNQYLYRMFLFPQTMYEIDEHENSIHYDVYSQSVKTGKFFTNNGFWDTYRTVYPFYSLVIPEKYKEMLEGFRHFYQESGHLPKWLSPDERGLMPGTLINAVIADAAVKGLLDEEELEFFLDALIKEATTAPTNQKFGRAGVEDTLKYGYVTNDEVENVNQTQDNAYSDFCIMQVARVLGNEKCAGRFKKEALNYRQLFDQETGFLRGKDADGNFSDAFIPEDWGFDYTEGSAWQNAMAFYHDTQGYIQLIGGSEQFLEQLTKLANEKPFFEIGNYGMEIHEMSEMATADFGQIAISNQPSFHIPYLYTYAGKPEYTQHVVKQLCSHAFSSGFDGFPGDEDNGSMSGWVIFSHLGFYPVTPGTNEYVFGIPQFDEMILQLPNEKTFTIIVEGNVPQYSFVKEVSLNGKPYDKLYLTQETILNGGKMRVELGLLPTQKEYTIEQLPYSLSNE